MDILERFHLALSYLEKSEEEQAGWERIRETEDFDHSQYDLIKSLYRRHVNQAKILTDTIRNSQTKSVPGLEEVLRDIDRKQRKLIKEISSGKLDPKQANRRNRIITKEQSRFEDILASARAISEAESTADFGGRIELTFEEFEDKLEINDEESLVAEKPPREFRATNVVILVLLGVIAWAAWTYWAAFGKASWETEVKDHKQFLHIRCTNTGEKSIRVYAPWPDGSTTLDMPQKLQRITFGILLYIREKGKPNFQLLPDSPGVWNRAGQPFDSTAPVIIRPGERLDIVLDVQELRKLGITIDAVKLEYTRYGGRKVDGHELRTP